MTRKAFASQADLEEKKVSFTKLSDHAYAYTAEGDPNTGIVIGDDAVMVIDTQATPVMAQDVIRRIREVTDKPIRTSAEPLPRGARAGRQRLQGPSTSSPARTPTT
jgi:alkyl sulfatase BDS1-like metallo-beta-lactamase superfamily hydrolase